jgi:glycosyltransferase involved in cell wall biosynthesis
MKEIIIIGRIPPPIGGVTVHTKRLLYYLDKKGIKVLFLDIKNTLLLKIIFSLFKYHNIKLVHLQISNIYVKFLLTLILKLIGKSVINTFHSFRYTSKCKLFIIKLICKASTRVVTVGDNDLKKVEKYCSRTEKLKCINSFIPPTESEIDFRKSLRKEDVFIIVINAYALTVENNKDIYGIDSSIELIRILRNKGYYVNLEICLGQIGDYSYYNLLMNKIKNHNLDNFIHFNINKPLIPVLINSDLFIRPTLTDAYGISIAESLFLNIPAIASNVCERPEGTIIYDNNKFNDLYDCVTFVINNYSSVKNKINNNKNHYKEADDLLGMYYEIYNNL